MNDLDLIREVRPEAPLAAARELAGARARLTAAVAAEGRSPSRAHRAGARQRLPWRVPLAVASVAVAFALGVALLLFSAGLSRGPNVALRHTRPAWSSVSKTHRHRIAVPTRLTAVQFLNSAATAVASRAAAPPSPGQYVYSENVTAGGGWSKEWLSATGAKPGLVESSGTPAGYGSPEPPCTVAKAEATGCYIAAGYLPGFPVHARAVLPYLAKLRLAVTEPPGPGEPANWLANDTGKAIGSLLQTTYLLPAQQSAIFRLLARTPGFQIVRSADDPSGRPGVGIYWAYQGSGAMIVFDPATYAFLGFGTWPVGGQPVLTNQNVTAPDGTSLTALSVVNALPAYHVPSQADGPRPLTGGSRLLKRLMPQVRKWAATTRRSGTVLHVLIAYLRQVLHLHGRRLHAMLSKLGIDPAACYRHCPNGH